jgi:hypothetical protein
MRAAEFMRALADIIDKLDGPADDAQPVDNSKPQQNPVFVSPLQQEIELSKAEQGKQSPVIDKLTADDDIGAEPKQRTARSR